ncbi:MAG: methylglyoxal synthase [Propionibacteriaceae bacterium]|nr:methylglyoxal synthase [Propionibacteriaceae bacterium]
MRIGLVAHDNCKGSLLEWCVWNRRLLARHELFATGTTGTIIEHEAGLKITKLLSGPKGGDQQIGAMIATGKLDALFFFWDPETPQPHDPDVKALLRLATLWNMPTACNVATADMIVSSPLFESKDYEPLRPEFAEREIEVDADGNVVIADD